MKSNKGNNMKQPTHQEIENAYDIYKSVYNTMIDTTISFELFKQKFLMSISKSWLERNN